MNAQSKPVDPNTPLDDFQPARFLKVSDLLERWKMQEITVTIARVMDEVTIPNAKDLDPTTADEWHPKGKPREVIQKVLYFRQKPKPGIEHISQPAEFPRGYLVSAKVDIQSLKTATKATTAGELIGKRIVIMAAEYNHQAVLRISPMPPME